MKPFSKRICDKINNDRNPIMTLMFDKIRVKEYVDRCIGENSLFDHRIHASFDITLGEKWEAILK